MSTLKANSYQHVDRASPSIIINSDGSVSISSTVTYEDITSVDSVGVITGRSNADLQNRVNVGSGVSIKAGGLNVTAGISTFGDDVTFTGAAANITFDKSEDDLVFNDNAKAVFGTGLDLKLWHDGSNSRLKDSGTGSLMLGGSTVQIENPGESAVMSKFIEDGAVELYHAGTKRLTTTTSGISISNELNVVGVATIGGSVYVKGNPAEVRIQHTGNSSYSRIISNSTNELNIYTGGGPSLAMTIDGSQEVGIGTASPTRSVHINKNSAAVATVRFTNQNAGISTGADVGLTAGGDIALWHGDGKNLILGTSNLERARISSDGNVLIEDGTVAAEAPLHVTAENSQGINAIFGAKDFVVDDQYNYDDANIALQGRDKDNNETGAGVQFTVRNAGNSTWLHGAFVLDRDANYLLYRGAGNTDGPERLRITSSGNIGVGETNPSSFGGEYRGIDVAYRGSGISGRTGNATFTMRSNIFYDGSNWKYGEGNTTAGVLSVGGAQLIFENAASGTAGATATLAERLRINADGTMLLGTTNTNNIANSGLKIQTAAVAGTSAVLNLRNPQLTGVCGARIEFNMDRTGGGIHFQAGAIDVVKKQEWTSVPGTVDSDMSFSTILSETLSEKCRVGAGDGSYFMIGTTNNRVTGSSFNPPTLGIQHTDTGWNSIGINQIRPGMAGILYKGYQQTGGNYYPSYMVDSNDQVCGNVLVNTSNQTVSYTNSSDYRLKQDDVPISDGITRVKQLRPIRFKWKSNLSETQDGFFAHEVQAVVPEAVYGEKDAMRDTAETAGPNVIDATKIAPQQLDTRYMVPLLTAALKEAIAKIETLETKVAALESA